MKLKNNTNNAGNSDAEVAVSFKIFNPYNTHYFLKDF